MTKEEANIIFRSWQNYIETAEKLRMLMLTPPEAFLPYPVDTLEEALNIIAKDFFDAGDKKRAEEIKSLLMWHTGHYLFETGHMTDEVALEKMHKMLEMILAHPPLKKTVLENLKKSQDSWIAMRRTGRPQGWA